MKRLIVYLVMFILVIGVVQWKKGEVMKSRSAQKTTIYSLWNENGIPVKVVEAKKKAFAYASLFPAEKKSSLESISFLTDELQKQLNVGQAVWTECQGKVVRGKVKTISPGREFKSGLYPISVAWNSNISCEYLQVSFNKKIYNNTIVLPEDILVLENDQYFAFLLEGNKVVKHAIKVKKRLNRFFIPENVIKEGSVFVLEGKNFLKEGSVVSVVAEHDLPVKIVNEKVKTTNGET